MSASRDQEVEARESEITVILDNIQFEATLRATDTAVSVCVALKKAMYLHALSLPRQGPFQKPQL